MSTQPTISRAEWDAMSGAEAIEYINAGGRVPPSPEIEAARAWNADAARATLEGAISADRTATPTVTDVGMLEARLAGAARALEEATTQYDASQATLYYGTGRRVHGDERHAEHEARHRATLAAALAEAETIAQQVAEQATAARALLSDFDPLAELPTAELERVNALRAAVAEDCDHMSLAALARRVESVLAAGDRPLRLVYSRHIRRRLVAEEERDRARSRRGGQPRAGDDQAALRALHDAADRLIAAALPTRAASLARLDQVLSQARQVPYRAKDLRSERDGTQARHQAAVSAAYRRVF